MLIDELIVDIGYTDMHNSLAGGVMCACLVSRVIDKAETELMCTESHNISSIISRNLTETREHILV